jgi:hypothetical protein
MRYDDMFYKEEDLKLQAAATKAATNKLNGIAAGPASPGNEIPACLQCFS